MGWLEAAQLVVGTLFGNVYPRAPARPLPDFDARTHALRRFADFLSLVEFSRTGDGAAIRYQIPRANIFIEQPDEVTKLRFPSLAFLGAEGNHEQWQLGPSELIEESRDVYGRDTALLDLGEYTEIFAIEAWTSHPAERRSLIAGLTTLLRMDEQSQALTLTLPNYYNRTADFWLERSRYNDDPDVIRGRRRGAVVVGMQVQEVLLVDVRTMRPVVDIEVAAADDPRTDV